MSTSQTAATVRGWGVKAGMTHYTCELSVRVAANCVISR